jgi:hypothetical protein
LDFRSGQAEVYIFSSGYTRTGTDVRVVPEDTTSGDTPVSVTFAEVLVEGTTTVTAYEQGPPPDAGFKFGNPPIYYDVATTAEYESPLIVCFNYEEARFGNEDQLDIRHYEDTNGDGSPDQWVDATYSLDTVNNIICALVDSLSLFAVTEPDGSPEPEVVEVTVDIKPGSEPNCINNDGHGVIPVAVLGSADFSVRQIDPMSVALAALTIKVVGKNEKLLVHYEDVNGDGQEDLVAQVEDMDGVFSVGDSTATLTGTLYDGTLIEGTDSLCIVP